MYNLKSLLYTGNFIYTQLRTIQRILTVILNEEAIYGSNKKKIRLKFRECHQRALSLVVVNLLYTLTA